MVYYRRKLNIYRKGVRIMDKKIMLTSFIISLSIMSSKNIVSNDKTVELQNENKNKVSIESYDERVHEIGDPGDYEPE